MKIFANYIIFGSLLTISTTTLAYQDIRLIYLREVAGTVAETIKFGQNGKILERIEYISKEKFIENDQIVSIEKVSMYGREYYRVLFTPEAARKIEHTVEKNRQQFHEDADPAKQTYIRIIIDEMEKPSHKTVTSVRQNAVFIRIPKTLKARKEEMEKLQKFIDDYSDEIPVRKLIRKKGE